MTSITPDSAALRARSGLLAAVRAAVKGERVDVLAGFAGQPTEFDWVALGGVGVASDPATVAARRSRDETITLDLNVGSFAPGYDDEAVTKAWGRAAELLAKISTYVEHADNTTLGGAVSWTLTGSAEWDGEEVEGGYQVEVAATFVCSHRVRAV
ncbi:hypothetical protein BKA24_001688 [Microbacterium marinum]|uniref:Tail terminator n=1 Tax=Microbacterium marinum TaxID=421115 RepID=A0A7W7BSQ0_9MICO|nr:hypothetical protein [Microbacterium marinum]MBB4666979.1 hypothetical protein [Microbacterium marinum]